MTDGFSLIVDWISKLFLKFFLNFILKIPKKIVEIIIF